MTGIITVEELAGPRFAAALELLREGGGFSFDRVVFRLERPGRLLCVVESSWGADHVSESSAINDFEFCDEVLRRVQAASPDFAALTHDASRRFELVEYAGQGSVLLASREGGQVVLESVRG